ncbi:MAG: GtrA family protein [Candidatus Dadabacteria bacterium]|nr:GtrA family protein [Candidatus Dadabacteria bacterium]
MKGEFIRFLMVGGAKTVLTYGIYLVLLYFINPYWAYIASFVASVYPSYLLNVKFTFRAEHSSEKLVSYPLVFVVQMLAGLAALHISLQAGASDKLAPIFAIMVGIPVGFLMARWVIGEGKENRNPVLFLAVSAFAVSIAAIYGALLNGDLFLHGILFSSDEATPFVMWQDVRAGIFSYADWNFQRIAPTYLFTDFPVIWSLFWLTSGNIALGTHLFGALMMFLHALAWMLVSDFLFGKDPLRRAFVFILCTLGWVILAYGADAVLPGEFLTPTRHASTWVVAGFGVFLFLYSVRSRRTPFYIFLFILCLTGVVSDPILTVWFVAPAATAGILWAGLFRTVTPVFSSIACIAGFLCSPLLREYFIEKGETTLQYSGFGSPDQIIVAFRDMGTWAAETAVRHPILAVVWVLFFVLLLRAVFKGIRSTTNTKAELLFVLMFFFFASAASVVATVLSGNFFLGGMPSEIVGNGRYFIPARAVPLFIGWAFLITSRITLLPQMFTITAVILMTVCAPYALALKKNGAALVNYYPPSAQCFDEGIRRFGLKKGLATYWWTKSIMATSKAEVQIAQVSVYLNREGKILLYPWKFGVPDRFYEGPFDFIIANTGKGPPERDLCSIYKCGSPRDPLSTYILSQDRAMAWAAQHNRQPSAVFECEGAKILVFNPPL